MDILVKNGQVFLGDKSYAAALGRNGLIAEHDKREGDGCTPIGSYPLRQLFYRADRLAKPRTALPCRATQPHDGWCDDPTDPAYNQLITRPYAASHEEMWREDHVYDLVLVLGHNDSPPQPFMGSCIFMHLARDEYAATAGCVAVNLPDMLEILAALTGSSRLVVAGSK